MSAEKSHDPKSIFADSTLVNNSDLTSIQMMLEELDNYREEIFSEESYRLLKVHLTALVPIEEGKSKKKIIKHLEGFKRLLHHQKENRHISETVYQKFMVDANNLIKWWQEHILLENPGFESPVVDGTIPGWQQVYGEGKMTVVDTIARTGTYSLHVDDDDDKSYGLESDPVEIAEGNSYTASVMTYVQYGIPSIYIRFYNEDYERIDQKVVSGGTEGKWTNLSVTATAPEEAVYVSVILYSTTTGKTSAFFDDVMLKQEIEEENNIIRIGTPIMSVTIPGASYGKGPEGEDWIYAVANGSPAILNIIDAHTGDRVNSFELEGVHNSWGSTVAPDGTVYIGSQRNGYLYRWVPESDQVDNLGPAIEGETHIWRVTTDDDGQVYGGTYPGGKVFQYDPETNIFHDYGSLIDGVKYVRSIAFGRGKVYAGLGTPAKLVELDPESGNKRVISLPEDYEDEQYIYDISYAGNLLFARLTPANVTLVYDLVEDGWVDTIENTPGIDVSMPGPRNKVYLRKNDEIYAYDLKTRQLEATGVKFFDGAPSSRSFGWIELEEPDYPGLSLVSINSRGNIFFYNPLTGNNETVEGDVEGQPNDIQSLEEGPDGNIYIGGYLSPQGMGVYNPDNGELKQLDGIGQIEGMGVHQGKLYLGTYPGANIYEYEPGEKWDFGTNPKMLFSLKEGYKQDRPFAFTSTGDRLAIGTVPDYGELGGALTLFDPYTGDYDVHRHVVENQSVIELRYRDGYIYGGTSIWGGYGIDPKETEAKLFLWDVSKNEKVWEGVPVSGEEAVSAITFDDKGYLWGLTAGYVFKFDPATREVVQSEELFSFDGGSMYYTGRDLVYGEDGYLYGTTLGKVFKLDSETWEMKVLADNAELFAQDVDGDIYFARGAELYKIDIQ